MQLVQLQYVVKIVEKKSISEAARDLFVSQPTVSQALKDLEKEMGFKIFRRNHRGVLLTLKGKKVYLIAKEIVREVNELQRFAQSNQDVKMIRIASVPMVSGTILLNIIHYLYKKFPQISVYPDELRPHQVLRQFEEDNLDIALCSKRKEDENLFADFIANNDVQYEIMGNIPVVAVVSNDSPFAKHQEITRAELMKSCRYIGLRGYYDPNISNIYCLSNRDLILNAVAHNQGFTIIPETAVIGNRYLMNQKIVTIKMVDQKLVPLILIYSGSDLLTPTQEQVVKRIKEYIKSFDY